MTFHFIEIPPFPKSCPSKSLPPTSNMQLATLISRDAGLDLNQDRGGEGEEV